ncbi:hypothetical protein GIB67_021968 [Kingdonia uniflora]|uniref:RNase H type-1 domain-containing protein n=1 Tax=Kingdonia uniflora TaxID=39325 RepID=A0A7J7P8H7_9MAGN|nr:hypothetical protein GIB67_021968 [Kingdonia uniflora]
MTFGGNNIYELLLAGPPFNQLSNSCQKQVDFEVRPGPSILKANMSGAFSFGTRPEPIPLICHQAKPAISGPISLSPAHYDPSGPHSKANPPLLPRTLLPEFNSDTSPSIQPKPEWTPKQHKASLAISKMIYIPNCLKSKMSFQASPRPQGPRLRSANTQKFFSTKPEPLLSDPSSDSDGDTEALEMGFSSPEDAGWRTLTHHDFFTPKLAPNIAATGLKLTDDLDRHPPTPDPLKKHGPHWSNGESVDLWLEPWIPDIRYGRPEGPGPLTGFTTRVAGLIHPNSRSWNTELILTIFHPEIAEIISAIPLSSHLAKDVLRWKQEKIGILTVKSAHNYSTKEHSCHFADTNTAGTNRFSWDGIWQLQVPLCIQLFLWKVVQEGIPMKFNLWHGTADWDTNCTRCGSETESTAHALFFCTKIHDIWIESDLAIDFRSWNYSDCIYSIIYRCFLLSQEASNLFSFCSKLSTIMYAIWIYRNELVFERKIQTARETLAKAKRFLIVNPRNVLPMLNSRPPPFQAETLVGWHVINVDASWFSQDTPGGTSFIIKSHQNLIVCAGCGSIRAADPEEAEAVAVVRGMEAALRIGVLILTDCQRLVLAFRDSPEDLSWGALTWAPDIRALATRFEDFRFEFVHRSCNYDAYFLAAWGACTLDFAFLEGPQVSAFVDSVRPDR